MGFTKLDEGILQSSVMAADPVTFKVWVALLAACKADGIAPVAATFLAAVCRLPLDAVRTALDELASPDQDSRTTTHDGRRIERVDGGWRLINYSKYRESGLRDAVREYDRERKRAGRHPDESGDSGQTPDPSASASASASGKETYSPPSRNGTPPPMRHPADRAEAETTGEIRRLQNELGARLARLSEHPNSRDMVPAWSRRVTSYKRKDGVRMSGVADYRTVLSIDRLERSIEDAEQWLAELDKGPLAEASHGRS